MHPDEPQLVVLMPVFNDWRSVSMLLRSLDRTLDLDTAPVRVLLVDDGSTESDAGIFAEESYRCIQRVDIVRLRRNVGHQRAICVGLSYIAETMPAVTTIVMDADGEDAPEDVPRLLRENDLGDGRRVIFAERKRRSESWLFRVGYHFYRWAHLLLVGQRVRFGNFSVVPPSCLVPLVVSPELWSHYAAAVLACRIPYHSVPCNRAARIAGSSKMGFVSLVVHGLSALAVFSDRIGSRVLLGSLALMACTLAGLVAVVGIRLGTELAIPGWATYAAGGLLLLLGQLVGGTTSGAFVA